jgi:DNA-directed RNA polymerase specialized sigma24 family protein
VSLNYDRFGLEVRFAVAGREQNREFREVSALREIEGLSYEEIADVSGVPVGTAMSRKARASDRLKHTLPRLIK